MEAAQALHIALSVLPKVRRPPIAEKYWRAVAAERAREAYAERLQRMHWEAAMQAAADAVREEREEFAFVDFWFVHRAVYKRA